MKPNKEIVQKADLALADLAPGGILSTKQTTKFLKIAIKKNVLTSKVRAPTLTNPVEEHPKILWTGRVMHPATGGVALPNAQRSKPTFDKVTLTTQHGKAEVHMHRETLEDQIERQVFKNTVTKFLAEKVSADLEDLLINGDTTSSDDWLATQNGMLALATTNVNTSGTVALSGDILRDLIQLMPEEFDDQPNMAFWTNRKARSDYRSGIRSRQTGLADGIYTGATAKDVGYDGVNLNRVPRFPNNLGVGTNETNVWYGDLKNVIYGFQRKVTVESEFRISEQTWVVVVTLRSAIQYEHEPAVAKATEVLGQ